MFFFPTGKYCGKSTPRPTVTLGNRLVVYFDTNDRTTEKGFKAAYRAVDPEMVTGNNTQIYNII